MAFEIKVPSSLSEISLEKFQKFMKLREENDNEEFINHKMIEIFCGIPLSDVYKLKATSVFDILEVLNRMFNEEPRHVERFWMNGVEYGFIPDLDEMEMAEYVDAEGNLSDIQNLHLAMNVLYRPIKDKKGDKYNLHPYNLDNLDKMKDMPTSAALGAIFFLISLGRELSISTILYSQEAGELQAEMDSEENGDGIHQSMHYVTEILQEWTKLQDKTSISV